MKYSVTDQEILKLFPYPTFRKGQKEIILKMNSLLNSGRKCILLSAPTGLGKSGINTTFARTMQSFYCTPQNMLIDQILNDQYLSPYFVEIKGRRNYDCIKDYEADSTVETGMCTRFKNYIPTYCDHIRECPYWSQKYRAILNQIILTNPTYIMLEGKVEEPVPPRLGNRDLLIVDEGHFIDDKIIDVASFEIRPWMIGARDIPDIKSIGELRVFVENVSDRATDQISQIDSQKMLYGEVDRTKIEIRNELSGFVAKASVFISSEEEEWVWEIRTSKKVRYLVVTPLSAELFGSFLWSKSKMAIVSSATLLNPQLFTKTTGLSSYYNPDEIAYVECPSVFPKENRPIVDVSIGNLSHNHQDENMLSACNMLEQILNMEPGNVAIHIPSYELVSKIVEGMRTIRTKHWDRFIIHSSNDRNEKLLKWTGAKGMVFFAVAFTEGYDWKADICDAQILFKVPYLDTQNKRIARLLALKRWNEYYTKTVTTVIQSYGRAVRSPEDVKRFYVLDSSLWFLLSKTKKILPDWFKEVIPKSVKI
jgi:Rad3-related DNA helicase